MDLTAKQAQVDTLTAQVATDENTLATDQTALATAKEELAQGSLINALEALSADDVSAINAALSSDTDNKTGISLSLPPVAETTVEEVPPTQ